MSLLCKVFTNPGLIKGGGGLQLEGASNRGRSSIFRYPLGGGLLLEKIRYIIFDEKDEFLRFLIGGV